MSNALAHQVAIALRTDGGITVSAVTGYLPTHGYVMALPGRTTVLPSQVTELATIVADYIESHFAELCLPNCYLGGWVDTETDLIYLDVVEIIEDRESAIIRAKILGELAIFHLDTHAEIRTV